MTTKDRELATCGDEPAAAVRCTHVPVDAGPQRPFIVQTRDPAVMAVRFWLRLPGESSGHWCDVYIDRAEIMRAAEDP